MLEEVDMVVLSFWEYEVMGRKGKGGASYSP